MEIFNKSVKNAIQFILCVQDSCDQHRKCMEHIWQQEYNMFVTEWKQAQIESKKKTEKTSDSNLLKDSKCVSKCPDQDLEELKELVLVDSLLKRARNIRMRHQKVVNGIIEYKELSTSSIDSGSLFKKSTNSSQAPEKNKYNKKMLQSKSDLAIRVNSHKSTVLPRSKSATAPPVLKEETKSYKNKNGVSSSAKCGAVNNIKPSEKIAVMSSKDLERFKRLHVNLPTCHELKSKKVASISDSSENKNQHQVSSPLSSRQFLSAMKGRLNAASCHIKLKLWYPFSSSKSEAFLTAVKCNTFCSVTKTCSILYSIQETMMWIDLLYLMEKEIYPTLILDTNDVNTLRICSYLLSIFHPTSQRVPILNPNR